MATFNERIQVFSDFRTRTDAQELATLIARLWRTARKLGVDAQVELLLEAEDGDRDA